MPFIFPPTHISYLLGVEFLREAERLGYEFIALHGPMATRIPFFLAMRGSKGGLLIYMGHGIEDAICGDSILCDMITVHDVNILKDMIVVAAPCCLTGRELAVEAVKAGAKAYVGSTEVMYASFDEYEHPYRRDWNDMFLTLYRGILTKTVEEAVRDYKNRCTYYMELYKRHFIDWPNADWNYMAAKFNRDYLTFFGDPHAKVDLPRKPLALDGIKEIMTTFGFFLPFLVASALAPSVVRMFQPE